MPKRCNGYTDEELVDGLINQDRSVVYACYDLFFDKTKRMVMLSKGSEEDARDVFQETMLVIYQKARQNQLVLKSKLENYLLAVARFIWLRGKSHLPSRSLNGFNPELMPDEQIDADHEIHRNEQLNIMQSAFESLSENCRTILSLFAEQRSIAEVTRLMGYKSEQHTRNRKYRCKLSLINRVRALYE